VTGHAQRR